MKNSVSTLRLGGLAMCAFALPGIVLGPAVLYAGIILGLTPLLATTPRTSWKVFISQHLRSRLSVLVAVVLASLAASSLGGISPDYNLSHWFQVLIVILIGTLMCHALSQISRQEFTFFWKMLLVSILIIMGISLIIAFFEPEFLRMGLYKGQDAWTQTRLRLFSSVLAVLLPFCWVIWLKEGNRLRLGWTGLAWCGASAVMVLICAGRAGWMGVTASAMAFGFMAWRYHGLKLKPIKLFVTAVATLGAGGVLYLILYGASSVQERIGITVPSRGLGGGRLDIWSTAWNHMFDNPLFGIGVEGFRFLPGADYHPHNFLLQFGLEGGMIGFALCLWLIGTLIYYGYRKGKTDIVGMAAFSATIGFWICALTNKSIFTPEWIIYIVVVSALLLQSRSATMADVPSPSLKNRA